MPFTIRSSRSRFREYRQKSRERREQGAKAQQHDPAIPMGEEKSKTRSRSFLTLLKRFYELIEGHRLRVVASLVALTISTIIGLAPLYGTKIVFDGVLAAK